MDFKFWAEKDLTPTPLLWRGASNYLNILFQTISIIEVPSFGGDLGEVYCWHTIYTSFIWN
jgi:hypothetical protein